MKKSQKIRILPTILIRRAGLDKYFNYNAKNRLGETEFTVPMDGGTLISLLTAQKGFKGAVLELLRGKANTGCFVDIGANYGQSMIEAFLFDNKIRYFGFEPNPEAFCLIKKVADANNNIDATLFPWACGSISDPIQLFASSKLDTSATIVPAIRPDTYEGIHGTWIASYPFDKVSGNLSLPHKFVLKIDVEGAENEVIQGSIESIREKRPFILCEVLHAHRSTEIDQNNRRKAELEQMLQSLGYSLYLCELSPSNGEQLLGIKKIECLPKNQIWRNSPHTCDYLFVPREFDDFFI
jgi:FkbM family methyltransferase